MMEASLSHVALLVRSAEKSAEYLQSLGFKCGRPQVFEDEGTKEIYVGSYEEQQGLLLLIEPLSEGPYQRAMSKRGPSLHHIAIDVLDMELALEDAQDAEWSLHPVSAETLSHNTAWLYQKGMPFIELQQRDELNELPFKISEIHFPFSDSAQSFFATLGLTDVFNQDPAKRTLVIDGKSIELKKIFVD